VIIVELYDLYTVMLILLICLNTADYCLTTYGLSIGFVELNPYYCGNPILKVSSAVVFAIFWCFTYRFSKKHGFKWAIRILEVMLYGLLAIYIFVVTNNILQLILC